MKDVAKATSRVIPRDEFRSSTPPEKCVSGDGASRMEVVWARAY
jgi:hypothetical protein